MAVKEILNCAKKYIYRLIYCIPAQICHKVLVHKIQKKRYANVVFVISELSMWKLQSFYELLIQDKRYNVSIVLAPFKFYHVDKQKRSIEELRQYFDEMQVKYFDATSYNDFDLGNTLHPDIIFYPQQYADLYPRGIDSANYRNRLLCFCPYALLIGGDEWYYNTRYINVAWKNFLPTGLHKEQARKVLANNARNVVVTGDPNFERFSVSAIDIWKPQGKVKRRLIWAPHFTIVKTEKECRDCFLWLSSAMLEVAEKYEDILQIAFKPHPHLLTELYNHPDWGKEKAERYYQRWDQMTNGQLVTGGYMDLFRTSDALIHDCGSFTADYLFVGKPVMFVSRQFESEYARLNQFGKEALNASYHGFSVEEVMHFIDSVVLGGDDPMADYRKEFANKYLNADNDISVAGRMKNEIDSSLF